MLANHGLAVYGHGEYCQPESASGQYGLTSDWLGLESALGERNRRRRPRLAEMTFRDATPGMPLPLAP